MTCGICWIQQQNDKASGCQLQYNQYVGGGGGVKWEKKHTQCTDYLNRPFLHKDFGCPEACLMAAPSGCSVF